jgi:MYXO-CTERM domain-containing protein
MKRIGSAVALVLAAATAHAELVQEGEIVVIEGDETTVTGTGGGFAIGPGNIDAILSQFYAVYPDEFDMVAIWETFVDENNGGAYFTTPPPVANRLFGFINMNGIGVWTGFSALNTMGQEFGHAWLSWETFVDPGTGMISDELLGRDGSHWSSVVDMDGSVMDGVDWEDNGDGTFTVVGIMDKFGPLDLWVMGFVEDHEVPPFYILRNPSPNVSPLGIWEGLNVGNTVTAQPFEVTIEDVIAAEGPQPPIDMRQHDFRVACLLITRPGETAEEVTGMIAELDEIRRGWNDIFTEWTLGRGTMCTDTSAPCDIPKAQFAGGRVREGTPSDGDGVVEAGEHAAVEIDWHNNGTSTMSGAIASLTPLDPRLAKPVDLTIEDIPVGATRTSVFDLTIPSDIGCDLEYVMTAVSTFGGRTWRGSVGMIPGVLDGPVETFATSAGWMPNLDAMDTAGEAGRWSYGVAQQTSHLGYQLQPDGGKDGPGDAAWWTGHEEGFGWDFADVDLGFTRLFSAEYDVSGMLEPTLRYHVWYQAWNFNFTPPRPTEGDDLIVEVTADGGVTWTEVDRVANEPRVWERREAHLAGKIPANATAIQFRFTAQDSGAQQNAVEIGVDDVSVYSLSPSCASDGGGCGCRAAGDGESAAGGAILVGAIALFALRRRRRGA